VDRDLEIERASTLRTALNARGSKNRTLYVMAAEKQKGEDDNIVLDRSKIDRRVLPPMRRKKYYY